MWPKHIILTIIRGDEEEFHRFLKNETESDLSLTYDPSADFDDPNLNAVIYGAGVFLEKDRFHERLLHIAVAANKIEFVKSLIDAGYDINSCNRFEETALHIAVANGYSEIVELLVEKGANVKSVFNSANKMRNESLTKLLLDHGADANYENSSGSCPLHHVAKHHNPTIARMILAKGANVNKQNNDGYTPLLIAICRGDISLIKFLLDNGADVSIPTRSGYTPLMVAICRNNDSYDIFKLLLEKGVNYNEVSFDGSTSLSLALGCCDLRTIKLLLNYGANIREDNEAKFIELHYAARNKHADVIKYFLGNGINVNARSQNNRTPLHIAAEFGHSEGCKLLLSRGANVNCIDDYGHTPLYLAVIFRDHKIIRDFLQYGAEVCFKYTGLNAIMILARTCRDPIIINILIEHIAKLVSLNISVNKIELEVIEQDNKMKCYYQNCIEELEKMKIWKVHENISLFNILMKKCMASGYARNEDLINVLDSADNQLHNDFPIYYSSLKEDFYKEIKKQRLVKGAAIVLNKIFNFHDPFHLANLKILNCLSKEDIIRINETK